MSLYLDASVLISLFIPDSKSADADRILRRENDALLVSDVAAAEFASGLSRNVRNHQISAADARSAFSEFDEWTALETQRIETRGMDITTAAAFLRRLDSTLRTPDAIHIAVAHRMSARLLTFDKALARIAGELGTSVVKTDDAEG